MLTAKEIRQSFKDYFESKGHHIVPSAPMVIKDDPTLMFTNAGMNQFKDIILGTKVPKYRRVADSQKCLRVSGKHNDLEEVGLDTYHHTMFEMLGNWSFGDYFKKEAIDWAWEFLTEVLGLNPERLYATVFEGYAPDSLSRDEEAAAIWSKHLPASHIINGNRHDNFWEMGDTGPCGPCSEIHIDLRPQKERDRIPGESLVNKGHPQVIEIWNLVFMQFDRRKDGSLHPLPNKVIDTGMGFERLCMALQGKTSNYDTDVFQPYISKIAELSGKEYGKDKDIDVAMRVIADHTRTIAFSIADSQLPSNAKAGYVIRRILRRAVRYAFTFLGRKEPFIYLLVPTLVENMGGAYPELKAQQTLIEKVIKEEEEAFLRTLSTGMKLLDNIVAEARAKGKTQVSGKNAFILYDTYGFPLDLTELILRENGMTVDIDAFNKEMDAQKQRARNAAAVEADDWVTVAEGEQEFVGYDTAKANTSILKYRKVAKKGKAYYQIILSETPFYGEMGGQVGDRGVLRAGNGEEIRIFDTVRETGVTVHLAERIPSDPSCALVAEVDEAMRSDSAANHTATHLLHQALREVLGTHVEQKGSFVGPDSLRFDFSHFSKLTPEEIRKVEHIVNSRIREALPLEEHRSVDIAEARSMGAMALFGEKYGDKVRTVRFGSSIELCGGIHARNTGCLGMFRIFSESSVAAGVRRIEAFTGRALEKRLDANIDLLHTIAQLVGATSDIQSAVKKIVADNGNLKAKVEEFKSKMKDDLVKELIASSTFSNGIRIIRLVGPVAPDMVKNVAFGIKASVTEPFAFVAATSAEKKPMLTLMISDSLVKSGLNASAIIREAAKNIKGGGGGQPFFAQAGGKDLDGLAKGEDCIVKALVQESH